MKNLTGNANNFPSTIRSPEALVDLRQAITVERGLQDLADRTSYLNDKKITGPSSVTTLRVPVFDGTTGKLLKQTLITIDADGNVTGVKDLTASGDVTAGDDVIAGGDVVVTGSVLYDSARSITVRRMASVFSSATTNAWTRARTGYGATRLTSTAIGVDLFLELNNMVPAGNTITGIRVLVTPGGNDSIEAYASRFTFSGTTITNAFTSTAPSTTGTSKQWIDFGAITLSGGTGTSRELNIRAGQVGDTVDAVEVTYLDLGPINAR